MKGDIVGAALRGVVVGDAGALPGGIEAADLPCIIVA
jgi:hypothetical protein